MERGVMSSGKHISWWGTPVQGTDAQGKDVTASFGGGTNTGHTLLADGHVDSDTFMQSGNHDHFGPGNGAHDNVKSNGAYSGEGA